MRKELSFIQNSITTLLPKIKPIQQTRNQIGTRKKVDSLDELQRDLNDLFQAKMQLKRRKENKNCKLPPIDQNSMLNELKFLTNKLNQMQQQRELQETTYKKVEKYLLPYLYRNNFQNGFINSSFNSMNPNIISSLRKDINYKALFKKAVNSVIFLKQHAKFIKNVTYKRFQTSQLQAQSEGIDQIKDEQFIYQLMETLEIRKLMLQAYKILNKSKQNQKTNGKQEFTLKEQFSFSWSMYYQILKIIEVNFRKVIKQNIMRKVQVVIAYSTLNKCFPINRVLFLDEIEYLRFHQEKGYLIINQETEKLLVLNILFIRIFAFNFLSQLSVSSDYFQQHRKQLNLKKNQIPLILSQFSILAIIMIIVSRNLCANKLNERGNYSYLDSRLKVLGATINYNNSQQETTSHPKISDFLKSISGINELKSIFFDQHNEDYQKCVNLMKKISQLFYSRLLQLRQKHFSFAKAQVMKKPYILIQNDLYKMKLLSQGDKQQIKSLNKKAIKSLNQSLSISDQKEEKKKRKKYKSQTKSKISQQNERSQKEDYN